MQVTFKTCVMKKTDFPKKNAAENRRKSFELERQKDAWKKYELNLRQARSGYSELELDEI